MTTLQVKGFAWLNVLTCVREQFGVETLNALKAAYPQHAMFFDESAVLPVGWVPGELHCGAIEWVTREKYGGSLDGAQTIGTLLASRNLSSTFRSLSRLEDLRTALASTQRAFGQFYSRGSMAFTVKDVVLEARLTDFSGGLAHHGSLPRRGARRVPACRAPRREAAQGRRGAGLHRVRREAALTRRRERARCSCGSTRAPRFTTQQIRRTHRHMHLGARGGQ